MYPVSVWAFSLISCWSRDSLPHQGTSRVLRSEMMTCTFHWCLDDFEDFFLFFWRISTWLVEFGVYVGVCEFHCVKVRGVLRHSICCRIKLATTQLQRRERIPQRHSSPTSCRRQETSRCCVLSLTGGGSGIARFYLCVCEAVNVGFFLLFFYLWQGEYICMLMKDLSHLRQDV